MAASNFDARAPRRVLLLLGAVLVGCGANGTDASERAAKHDGLASYEMTDAAPQWDAGAATDSRGDAGADGGPAAQATPTGGFTCNDVIASTAASVEVVLQRSCGLSRSCHAGNAPQAGLNLSSLDDVFRTAVARPSTQAPELLRIVPGAPDESYLMRKIRNLQNAGTAMPPPPIAALCDAKARPIEAWIRDGAQR